MVHGHRRPCHLGVRVDDPHHPFLSVTRRDLGGLYAGGGAVLFVMAAAAAAGAEGRGRGHDGRGFV